MSFSYTQAAEVNPFEMSEEEFNNYLGTLPKLNPQELEELIRIAEEQDQRNRLQNQAPASKRKSNQRPIAVTCNRQP